MGCCIHVQCSFILAACRHDPGSHRCLRRWRVWPLCAVVWAAHRGAMQVVESAPCTPTTCFAQLSVRSDEHDGRLLAVPTTPTRGADVCSAPPSPRSPRSMRLIEATELHTVACRAKLAQPRDDKQYAVVHRSTLIVQRGPGRCAAAQAQARPSAICLVLRRGAGRARRGVVEPQVVVEAVMLAAREAGRPRTRGSCGWEAV